MTEKPTVRGWWGKPELANKFHIFGLAPARTGLPDADAPKEEQPKGMATSLCRSWMFGGEMDSQAVPTEARDDDCVRCVRAALKAQEKTA